MSMQVAVLDCHIYSSSLDGSVMVHDAMGIASRGIVSSGDVLEKWI